MLATSAVASVVVLGTIAVVLISRGGGGRTEVRASSKAPPVDDFDRLSEPLPTSTTTISVATSTSPSSSVATTTSVRRATTRTVPQSTARTTLTVAPSTATTTATTSTASTVASPCADLLFVGSPRLGPDEAYTDGGVLNVTTGETRGLFGSSMYVVQVAHDGETLYALPQGCGQGLWAVPLNGSTPYRVLDAQVVQDGAGAATPRLAVSPDGRRVFVNGRLIEVESGRVLASGAPWCWPDWMADGRHLVCVNDEPWVGSVPVLHVLDADDGFKDAPIPAPDGCQYTGVDVGRGGQRAAIRMCNDAPWTSVVVLLAPDGTEGMVMASVHDTNAKQIALDPAGRRAGIGGYDEGAAGRFFVVEPGTDPLPLDSSPGRIVW